MRLFEYQQFWEYRTAMCAKCDIAYYKATEESSNWCFQVGLDTDSVTVDNNDFAANPFNEVEVNTMAHTFSFEINALPDEYYKEFILYICGKVIRIKRYATYPPPAVVINGNEYQVPVYAPSLTLFINAIVSYLDTLLDSCGVSVTRPSGNTILFSGVTDRVWITDNYALLSSVIVFSVTGNVGYNFIYQDEKMCFDVWGNGINSYQFKDIALISGKRYKFSIDYSSSYSDFIVNLSVSDGINPNQIIPFTIVPTSSGTADVYFTALASVNHSLKIMLSDPGIHNTGFCFDNVSLSSVCFVQDVFVNDITNNVDSEHFTVGLGNMTVDYYGTKALICINAYSILINHPVNDCYQMVINDTCGNTINTNYFKFFVDDCTSSKFIQLDWWNDCKFGDLDYTHLPFTNTMFVKGYKKRIPLNVDDRITSKNPDGSVSTLFSVTAKRYEINTGKYSEVMHEQLERIFENKYVLVATEEYYKDNKDIYIIRDIGDVYYSGKIELTKKGTEVISSACCC